jgi:hypothetical protein
MRRATSERDRRKPYAPTGRRGPSRSASCRAAEPGGPALHQPHPGAGCKARPRFPPGQARSHCQCNQGLALREPERVLWALRKLNHSMVSDVVSLVSESPQLASCPFTDFRRQFPWRTRATRITARTGPCQIDTWVLAHISCKKELLSIATRCTIHRPFGCSNSSRGHTTATIRIVLLLCDCASMRPALVQPRKILLVPARAPVARDDQ